MPNENRIMLDLEAMGVGPDAAIVSIGAVRFDTEIKDSFYRNVLLESSVEEGMKIEPGAVMWWIAQSDDARSELSVEPEPIGYVLWLLSEWMLTHGEVELWGNGSDFDNVILGNAFDLCRQERPWQFYQNRCFRTMKTQFPVPPPAREGTHHNALDDAIHQANHLIKIEAYIKGGE